MITVINNMLSTNEVASVYNFLNAEDFVWHKIDDYKDQAINSLKQYVNRL